MKKIEANICQFKESSSINDIFLVDRFFPHI